MKEGKDSNYREDFPGYQGHIPYKFQVIGKTVGATNETVKQLLSTEPPKEELLMPGETRDFSDYDRDYYTDTFPRDYPLEEAKIFTNKSKDAQTWIAGDKYKIYPQHIPGVQCFVPGIYSANIFGKGYSKCTGMSIKGDYNKAQDCTSKERFTSIAMDSYKNNSNIDLKERIFVNPMDSKYSSGAEFYKRNLMNIYKSKIAQVPTPGYKGHSSVFQKKIGYLDYEKIMESEKNMEKIDNTGANLPPKYRESLNIIKPDTDVPYVVGYKGFRVGIKARNYHGENFHDASLAARNEAKFMHVQ